MPEKNRPFAVTASHSFLNTFAELQVQPHSGMQEALFRASAYNSTSFIRGTSVFMIVQATRYSTAQMVNIMV